MGSNKDARLTIVSNQCQFNRAARVGVTAQPHLSVDTILAIRLRMIHRARYGMLPGLIFLALAGCSDAKPRTEEVDGGRVSGLDGTSTVAVASPPDIAPAEARPADVVRHYYATIGKRQYQTAYALWADSGKASGKTRAEFARGFTETALTIATIGDSIRIGGAAGSQYATVPVTIDATLRDGTSQHFVGTYTLRRAMVDGATPEQRRWHIYSADLH